MNWEYKFLQGKPNFPLSEMYPEDDKEFTQEERNKAFDATEGDKWRYFAPRDQEDLDMYGRDGWELVSVQGPMKFRDTGIGSKSFLYILKRPLV
jgi:hypothetical protein